MYRIHQPAPELTPYIENYWAVSPDEGPVDLRVDVFVDGRADLIFTFGAPYQREVIGGSAVEMAASNLDAQRLVPIRIRQTGRVHLFGARFRLGGLGALVRVPLRPFTDQTPAPEAVFGPPALALGDGLRRASGLTEAAALLDGFFLAQLRRDEGRADFERALAVLVDGDGGAEVQTVAAATGLSGRQVERLFERHLGIAPKTVGRILRFQRALRSLMRDPGVTLAEVALAAGYFDQAHFIREFRRMSGGVPRGYRGYYPPAGPADFAPNVVAFIQDGRRRP